MLETFEQAHYVTSGADKIAACVKRAFYLVEKGSGLGLLIVTDVVASEAQAEVDRIRLECEHPLIAEIPGPDGPMKGRKTLREFVQEAVGISVGEEEDGGK